MLPSSLEFSLMRLTQTENRETDPVNMDGDKPIVKPRRKVGASVSVSVNPGAAPSMSESQVPNEEDSLSEPLKRPVPKPRPKPPLPLTQEPRDEPLPDCMIDGRLEFMCPEERKRMTISLFNRKLDDPFDIDFEESLKDASLTTVRSVREDVNKSTSESDGTDSESERAVEIPFASPLHSPKTISSVGSTDVRTAVDLNKFCEVSEKESLYEPVASYSSSESGLSEVGHPRPLSSISSFGGSKTSVRSDGNKQPLVQTSVASRGYDTPNGSFKCIVTAHPPSPRNPDPSSASGNVVSQRSSTSCEPPSDENSPWSSSIVDTTRVMHPYDEVTVEDGVVTIDRDSRLGDLNCGNSLAMGPDLNSARSLENSSPRSSSNTSRKSLLQEFDPFSPFQQPPETRIYEDIDSDEFTSLNQTDNSSDVIVRQKASVAENPQYLPVVSFPPIESPSQQSPLPKYCTDLFANFEKPSLDLTTDDKLYQPVNSPQYSGSFYGSKDSVNNRESTTSSVFTEASPSSPVSPDSTNAAENNIKHRITRLIPSIKVKSGTPSTVEPLRCSQCLQTHVDSSRGRCKYVPVPRENIVYSSLLYKVSGLSKRDFVKRWTYLSKGELNFISRTSGNPDKPTEVIRLDKVLMMTKKEDQRVGDVNYKCFQLYLGNGKISTTVLAGSTEKERANWMQKYIEAFTSNFPASVISSYDRAGWCFIKENTAGNWQPSWLILNDRKLFCSAISSEDYFQFDLRKAREISVSSKESDYHCPFVENNEVLTIHMTTKILYVQTENTKLTINWEKAIRGAALFNGATFEEMQLTVDDVPVIVQKCIDFLYAHGVLSEGIYRQSGANSRIAGLLEEFKKDAWAVQMTQKDFSAHDVAGALKRFFRTLPEPLVTEKLYPEWITVYGIDNHQEKMEQYMKLLSELPRINYNIFKKLIGHLHTVHELHESNLMPLENLAPIWGPTLMSVDESVEATSKLVQEYGIACAQYRVVRDLIENYHTLFRVDSQEIARERRIQEGLKNFHRGVVKSKASGDLRIHVYLHERDENSAISITLNPTMTAAAIVENICTTHFHHRKYENYALYEIIFNKSLERPVFPTEKVVDIIWTWSKWDVEERKTNYLILKTNTLYPVLIPYARGPAVVSGEFKYADSKSKSFRKYTFEFSQAKLKYSKDSKEAESWNIEDITWYIGHEPKRTPPCRYSLTFAPKDYAFKRSREEPYFGNTLSMNSEDELYRFIAAMIIGEHPEGLYPPAPAAVML